MGHPYNDVSNKRLQCFLAYRRRIDVEHRVVHQYPAAHTLTQISPFNRGLPHRKPLALIIPSSHHNPTVRHYHHNPSLLLRYPPPQCSISNSISSHCSPSSSFPVPSPRLSILSPTRPARNRSIRSLIRPAVSETLNDAGCFPRRGLFDRRARDSIVWRNWLWRMVWLSGAVGISYVSDLVVSEVS